MTNPTDELNKIMRKANAAYNEAHPGAVEDIKAFNPAALKAQGIDPVAYIEAKSRSYASETLSMHDNQSMYQDVIFSRCNKSLEIGGEYSFGRFLPEDIIEQLHAKLQRNSLACAYPRIPQL
jgi:hypothetical protein